MPCAHGCVCHSLVNPAKYFIFITDIPVSRSSMSCFAARSPSSSSIWRISHGMVFVSQLLTWPAESASRTPAAFGLMVPMMAATAIATAVAFYVDGYSIYSARLPAYTPDSA
jgi:hypothetical protein